MSLGFNRRSLRRIATVTLAAWLFAISSGIAHACAVAPPAFETSADAQSQVADDDHATTTEGVGVASAGERGHDDHDGRVADHHCKQFCDGASVALIKFGDIGGASSLPALAPAPSLDPFAIALATAGRAAVAQPPPQYIPLITARNTPLIR